MRTVLLLLSIGCITAACDSGKADDKKAESKAKVDTKAKADVKAPEAKAAEAKAPEAKAPEVKAPEPVAEDAKAAALPADLEGAARQMGVWLDDATKNPPPALLTATSEIELVERCGACDGKTPPKTTKIAGATAFTTKATELGDAVASGEWNVEAKLECKDDCCTFVAGAEGVGDNVVNLEKVCVVRDASGKPTAYSRIETSGSF